MPLVNSLVFSETCMAELVANREAGDTVGPATKLWNGLATGKALGVMTLLGVLKVVAGDGQAQASLLQKETRGDRFS
ncbi:hypothetical protein PC122_g11326 [Phytophthora cactorum]|nr:hypothetical protein PC122_g11326 [Phytophthora cactorum]